MVDYMIPVDRFFQHGGLPIETGIIQPVSDCLAEFFAGGIMFTAFASALLTKLWFDSGAQASELETGLTVGLVIISVLAAIALGLFRFTSKLRD